MDWRPSPRFQRLERGLPAPVRVPPLEAPIAAIFLDKIVSHAPFDCEGNGNLMQDVQTVRVADIPQYRAWLAAHPRNRVMSVTLVTEGVQTFLLVAYIPEAAAACACARRGPRSAESRLRRRQLGSMSSLA